MSGPKYRVKFYGFTAPDTQVFCRNLAGVLGITPEAARDLVLDAPVVIGDNLGEAAAQRLCESVTAIQGLCLVEGLDGSYVQKEAPQVERIFPLPEPPEEKEDSGESFRFRFWAVVICAVVAVFVCLAVVAYVSSYLNLNRTQTSAPPAATQTQEEKTASSESSSPRERYEALQNKIDEVGEQLGSLQTEVRTRETQLKRVAGTLDSDPLDVRRQQQELQGLRMEVAAKESELRTLKSQQDAMDFRP
jgi:hypothetical protein